MNYSPLYKVVFREIASAWMETKIRRYPPIYVRAADTQSGASLFDGLHEKLETETIMEAAGLGFNDFLIDIGANLGVMSVQVGRMFKQVHLFEPNRDLLAVLELNLRDNLTNYKVYPFALGSTTSLQTLRVPVKNIGGAFLDDAGNFYNQDELALKDSLKNPTEADYRNVEIEVREAHAELKTLFDEIKNNGWRRGVIKLDVEGYEPLIIQSILDSLPRDMSVAVVFENWSERFDAVAVASDSGRHFRLGQIGSNHPFQKLQSRLAKVINLIFNWWKPVAHGVFEPPVGRIGSFILWIE